MKTLVTNQYNLKDEEITEVVIRVKALVINSKREILLGYAHHTYQFPGGHVEENETLIEATKREILEETGITLNIDGVEPFACKLGYYKDWPEKGKNRKTEIYYYEVKTDQLPNLANTHYTEDEKKGNFKLKYLPLDKVEEELLDNVRKHGDSMGIAQEMLDVLKYYKDEYSFLITLY